MSTIASAFDSRLLHALTMVAVAAIGAFLAYKTGSHELGSVRLEREIAQQNLLTVTERQRLLDLADANEDLKRRADGYHARGQAYLDAARRAGGNAQDAGLLTLRAQEEFAAERALKPFVDATGRPFRRDADRETGIRRYIERFMEGKGIAAGPDSMTRLGEEMEHAHNSVQSLAAGVVVFILSLVVFTFSDLSRRPLRSRIWFVAGVVIAFAGIVSTVWLNRDLSPWLLGFAVLLLVLSVAAWIVRAQRRRKGAKAHHSEPGEIEPRVPFRGENLHIRHAETRFARIIVRLMSVTVLLSAICGFQYTRALIESSKAAHEALGQQINMNTASVRFQDDVLDRMRELADVQEARARFVVARYASSYLESRQRLAEAVTEAARADSLEASARDEDAAKWLADPAIGADADARFPQRFLNQQPPPGSKSNRWESLALWDAFNQRSVEWNRQASVLLATLTVFAVALYLLGQANSMGAGAGGWSLVIGGCLLAGAATVLAVYAEVRSVEHSSPSHVAQGCRSESAAAQGVTVDQRAARHYSRARALLTDARTSADYRDALVELECMALLRPESTLARADYMRATEMESTFLTDQPFGGLPRKEDLEGMTKRMAGVVDEYAKRRAPPPPRLLASFGRYTLLHALQRGDRKGVADSIGTLLAAKKASDARTASDQDSPDRPRVLLTLAVAQYAGGRDGDAEASANAALDAKGPKNKRSIARAITDLEILRQHCAAVRKADECATLAKRIDALKERLVAATWSEPAARPSEREASATAAADAGPRIDVAPDALRWRAALAPAAANAKVAAVWYEFDDAWQVWRAIPEASSGSSAFRRIGPWNEISYAAATNFERCLGRPRETRYRVELYVDGSLRQQIEHADRRARAFAAWRINDLNLAFCAPADWTALDVPESIEAKGMLARGLQTIDKQPAAFVFTFYGAARQADPDTDDIARVRELLTRRQWIRDDAPTFVRYERGQSCAGETAERRLAYVSWTTREGVRHIGVTLPGAGAWRDVCPALMSLANRYPPHDAVPANGTSTANVAVR
jgi:hypothetical protein